SDLLALHWYRLGRRDWTHRRHHRTGAGGRADSPQLVGSRSVHGRSGSRGDFGGCDVLLTVGDEARWGRLIGCPPGKKIKSALSRRSFADAVLLRAHLPSGRPERKFKAHAHEPIESREEPVSSPARPQSGGLATLGQRSVRRSEEAKQADFSFYRLFHLPLVPRHGARIVRKRTDCRDHQRQFPPHQGPP